MKQVKTMLLASIAILALAACGSQGSSQRINADVANAEQSGPPPESIEVAMNDIYYGESNDNATNPPVWSITSGADVSIDMTNKGVLEHNWAVVKLGEEITAMYDEASDKAKLLFDAGTLAAGESQTVDFSAPLPGEYQVICTVPGHSQVMQGKLIVNE
jgi:uncharacterized cupredoxin-like copper-binding protein